VRAMELLIILVAVAIPAFLVVMAVARESS
jgi:hypothetical protein